MPSLPRGSGRLIHGRLRQLLPVAVFSATHSIGPRSLLTSAPTNSARWKLEIPNPARTFADIALGAEIALHCADRDPNGSMKELDEDMFHASAARLIAAVLQFVEMIAPAAAMPAISPKHLEYRKLVAEARLHDR